ncbi:four helix bundle protein [Salegentibacter maritimus]|uniref:Four helix bundle protein n=1 Tax=Salegentibacter maritimus TaxID=2794347 RepID=A0ABS0TFC3_9FLAO|nr:four helix bundle protein [Salegentibacter maritimus]MBI6119759.1 four helix bundle protein [Salegentibacter maritimus]
MASNFEDLDCWKACYDLKLYVKKEILTKLPKTERFELYSQLLRSARSATANITEGWGRYHYKENIKFLLNARGSVAEILDHGIEAKYCDYISEAVLQTLRNKAESCLRLINGYIKYLRNRSKE